MKNDEFEMYTATGLHAVMRWRTFRWLQRRYNRTHNRMHANPDKIERIQLWQWYKALIYTMREKHWWNEDYNRPISEDEWIALTSPRIPGEQEWKKFYLDSPAWHMAWNKANDSERVLMSRWKWRVQKGLEVNGG